MRRSTSNAYASNFHIRRSICSIFFDPYVSNFSSGSVAYASKNNYLRKVKNYLGQILSAGLIHNVPVAYFYPVNFLIERYKALPPAGYGAPKPAGKYRAA